MASISEIAAVHNALFDQTFENGSSSSGSNSNAVLVPIEKSPKQTAFSYKSQIPLNTSVGFYLEQETVKGKTITITRTFFADYNSASAKFQEGNKAQMFLAFQYHGYLSFSFLKKRGGIQPQVYEAANVWKLLTDTATASRALKYVSQKCSKLTKIVLENVMESGLFELIHFPHLIELTVVNSALNESLKKLAESNLDKAAQGKCLSDESLMHLEKCPKLTKLTLIDVKDITNKALSALQLKKKDLSIKQEFTPPAHAKKLPVMFAKASIYFETYSVQIEDGHALSKFIFSQTEHEGKQLLQNKNFKYGYMQVQVKTSEVTQTFELYKAGKFPDISQIRKFTHHPEELSHDAAFIQDWIEKLKSCKDLKEIVLFNTTKKVLLCVQALTQVETIVVNNTNFDNAKKLLFTRSYISKDNEKQLEEQLLAPDDEAILDFKSKDFPNLKKMVMIACPNVKPEVADYTNATEGFRLYFKEDVDSEQNNSTEKQVVVVD